MNETLAIQIVFEPIVENGIEIAFDEIINKMQIIKKGSF
jgi:hypothetical protein